MPPRRRLMPVLGAMAFSYAALISGLLTHPGVLVHDQIG